MSHLYIYLQIIMMMRVSDIDENNHYVVDMEITIKQFNKFLENKIHDIISSTDDKQKQLILCIIF